MWKKFSIKILVFASTIVLFIGGFNWLVDPYDIFDSPKIDGFNVNKPETETKQRPYKAIKLLKQKPETVFFGTSRTDRGIDPDNKIFHQKSIFNASINGMTPIECEYMFNAAIKNGAKRIIIGTDLVTFYAKDQVREGFDKGVFSDSGLVKYILSIDALKSSVNTVASTKPTPYSKFGFMRPEAIQFNDFDSKGVGYLENFRDSEKGYLASHYKNFNKTQTAHWQAFERILDKAHKKGVKITLFISPSHARQWEVLAITQGWEMFEEYRRRLVATNEKIALQNGKAPFALWDFAGYHELTTEAVPDDPKAKMKWYWDSSHYKKELGDIVLDRMFDGNFSGGQNYPDFGVKLTSQNIDSHLAKLQAERERWRATHSADVAEIETLKTTKTK